ncbi:low molecular weight phosphotyrosine protein phosphatase [Sphingobacterium sp. SRCM116780]|uniref:low molecular weight protein-tyrosine-phosphatase n=1 Tax=Sphingobacterium sp. SRCM116780 TaxID=2907623 RepID=UPI001F1A37EF|nr:low molecular weight protein-tyrosine-phosphatase [Sphingobacterium sp. SRCM116780]UIR56118.1 low molecular weight phosphotyrosine protein phosphatase [Sphingobacterium sp. SRCM116780]
MNILMVCLGNICRSSLAHGILSHLAKEEGLDWTIESAGTGDWHIGQAPDRRSIAVAKKYNVDISHQRARHFNASLFNAYDHILVMDHQNYKDVVSQATSKEERDKVMLFLVDDIVPDPYFDENLFEPVYKLIENRCQQLIKEWK